MKIQIDSINTRKNQITVFDGEKNVVIPKKDFSSYTDGAKFIPVSDWCDNLDRLKITGKTEFPITFNQSQQDLAKKSKNTIIFSDEEPYPSEMELLSKRNIRFYVKDPSFNMDRIPYSATEVELDDSFTELPHFYWLGGLNTLILPNTVRTNKNRYNFEDCQNLDTLIYKGTREDFINNKAISENTSFSRRFDTIECEDDEANKKIIDLPIMTNEELYNFESKPLESYILHLDNNNLVDGQFPDIPYNTKKIIIEKDVVSLKFKYISGINEFYISEGVKNIELVDKPDNPNIYPDELNSDGNKLYRIKITIPKSTETLNLGINDYYDISYNGTIEDFNSKFKLPSKVKAICSNGVIPIKTPIELQVMTLEEFNAYQFLDTENYILHINDDFISNSSSINNPTISNIYKVIIDESSVETYNSLYRLSSLNTIELDLPNSMKNAHDICCCWNFLRKINCNFSSDNLVHLSYNWDARNYVEVTYNDGYTEFIRFDGQPPPM